MVSTTSVRSVWNDELHKQFSEESMVCIYHVLRPCPSMYLSTCLYDTLAGLFHNVQPSSAFNQNLQTQNRSDTLVNRSVRTDWLRIIIKKCSTRICQDAESVFNSGAIKSDHISSDSNSSSSSELHDAGHTCRRCWRENSATAVTRFNGAGHTKGSHRISKISPFKHLWYSPTFHGVPRN